jgi:hypothetical protein
MAESINIIIKNGAEKEVRHFQCLLVATLFGLTLAPPLSFPTPTLTALPGQAEGEEDNALQEDLCCGALQGPTRAHQTSFEDW